MTALLIALSLVSAGDDRQARRRDAKERLEHRRAIEIQREALKQVALADIVLLTKTDMSLDPGTLRDIELDKQRISDVNPTARILDRHSDWSDMREQFLAPGTYDLRTKGEDLVAWLRAEQVDGRLPGLLEGRQGQRQVIWICQRAHHYLRVEVAHQIGRLGQQRLDQRSL